MIITPAAKLNIGSQYLECVLIVDETGKMLNDVLRANTDTGECIHFMRGVNGKIMKISGTDHPVTYSRVYKQLYFTFTAGPSEQVVRELTAPRAQKEK
jgi:hypothetical protein